MEYWEFYKKSFDKPKIKPKKTNFTLFYEGFAIKDFAEKPYPLCNWKKQELIKKGYKKELLTIK